ncbi:virulence factor SrfB [Xanthobacteraceae bacterium A53D]
MLNRVMNGVEALTLIPQSGVQFVEYGFNLAETGSFSRTFIERPLPPAPGRQGEVELLPNWNERNPTAEPPHEARATDDEYSVSKAKAVEVFLGRWVPVPFLKIQPGRDADGNETYANGPQDWVRVRIVETRNAYGDADFTHRAVFAFDTTLVNEVAGRAYLGIGPDDALQGEAFRFVHNPRDIAGFIKNETWPHGPGAPMVDSQAWLTDWLDDVFKAARRRQFPHRATLDLPHKLEHVAAYMTLLGYLADVLRPAKVSLVDTLSLAPRVAPIDVDLVLDVGNSRTCGLLIQSFPNDQSVDLNRSLVLELRDLGNPVMTYREPFESKLELVHAEFGAEDLAKRSGRSRAFFWPSLVRLGPEAGRYRSASEGTEAMTGLSSPKRYLWDVEPVTQSWQFRNAEGGESGVQPLIERSIYRYVNNRGDVLAQQTDDQKKYGLKIRPADREPAESLRFSRSSFFSFMLVEIISQALMMINSPGARRKDKEKDAPRRLRSIVLTIPSATPVQEQRIIRSRTEGAIKLLWQLMGWSGETPPPGAPKMPAVHTFWDEASSVHLVYLYGEITQKLGGDIQRLFEVMGRNRPKPETAGQPASATPERSLRIASVDVGGGTTDVMVTTYYQLENRAIIPVQNFREGFRRAGDDLVKLVIERSVMPAIEAHLEACGLPNARNLLRDRFSDDSPGMFEADKHLRRQFVLGLLRPVALSLLEAAENPAPPGHAPEVRPFAAFFSPREPLFEPANPILAYLEGEVRRRGALAFSLAQVPVTLDPHGLDDSIRAAFETVFENIADAVYKLEADVVLLTGRPSCQPALISLFRNQHAVSVDRVIPIRDYRVGNWYPFRRPAQSVIHDPKTTAVVGGMLSTLASGQLMNFSLYTSGIVMRSTARFIGEMETDGVIKAEKLYFSDVELDEGTPTAMQKTITYYSPLRIGYRQLAREDWVAAPLYRLRMQSNGGMKFTPPIQVVIARRENEVEPDASPLALLKSEATREEFFIEEATDAEGKPLKMQMDLRLDTSQPGSDGTYWLDSGILTIA